MFCTKCGAQLQDDAKFCTACGARVAHPNAACAQAATCEANLEETAPLPPNPSADMATDAHAPETAPNANSADNVSPTHAATNPGAQTEQAVQGGDKQNTPAQPEESDANAEAPEVTEAPENILQVSRVLALGSEGEQFITTHGASTKTPTVETSWGYAAPSYSTNGDSVNWKDTTRDMPYVDSSAGSASDYSSVSVEYGNGAMFLVHGLDKKAGTYQPASATPDSIVVSGVPLISPITSNTIDDFAQQCGLSASSGSYELTTEATVHEYGETTNETTPSPGIKPSMTKK